MTPDAERAPIDARAETSRLAQQLADVRALLASRGEDITRLTGLLTEVRAERERLRAVHAAKLGVCQERCEEVRHWRDKATAYGDIVHGCSPSLERAGYPIGTGPAAPNIAAAVDALRTRAERTEAAADWIRDNAPVDDGPPEIIAANVVAALHAAQLRAERMEAVCEAAEALTGEADVGSYWAVERDGKRWDVLIGSDEDRRAFTNAVLDYRALRGVGEEKS